MIDVISRATPNEGNDAVSGIKIVAPSSLLCTAMTFDRVAGSSDTLALEMVGVNLKVRCACQKA